MSLTESNENIAELNKSTSFSVMSSVIKKLIEVVSYKPKIGVVGNSGVGKSSLCNAIFGREISLVSHVGAGTRDVQTMEYNNGNGSGFILKDFPGIGEDIQRNREYIDLYKKEFPHLDFIIWAIKGDDRSFASALEGFQEIKAYFAEKYPRNPPEIIFALTQVDKIEPYRDWDHVAYVPGTTQNQTIIEKVKLVAGHFKVDVNRVIPVSVNFLERKSYNLDALLERVFKEIPDSKKYSLAREVKKENINDKSKEEILKSTYSEVSNEASKHSEKAVGFFEMVWDKLKEPLANFAVEKAISLLMKLFTK
jgi:predicted GTPase